MKIYLAGGLYNAGERLHQLYLEKALKKLGHAVILPQREALRHFKKGAFDIRAVVSGCMDLCSDDDVLYVGCADGPDADSGASVEYGIAITATGKAIVYRTDFRTALDRELGINAMLTADGTSFVYMPCFFTELSEVESFYDQLALLINGAIKGLAYKTG